MSEELSRSNNTPIRTKKNRSKVPLRNQDSNSPVILQTIESQLQSPKLVETIRTFFIWSIFNLIFIPFGILCCYFSYKVHQYKNQNRYEMAKKWSKRTFVLNIITTLLMISITITIFMLHYDYEQRYYENQFNQTQTTISFIPWLPGR